MYKLITQEMLENLKTQAASAPKKRARIELHNNHGEVQEMVICLLKDSYVRAHMHPIGKAESYHVIEGELDAWLYGAYGDVKNIIRLGPQSPLYRLDGGIYHAPVCVSDYVIYHEVYPGPWVKDIDVQYAPWAREESV